MLGEAVLLAAIQIGPFFERNEDFASLRPFWSREGETTDVLWPLFTSHRDWWRFCFFMSGQEHADGGSQFSAMPLWYNGRGPDGDGYWGLFPFYGTHPHIAAVYDLEFAAWPLWMRYSMPRKDADGRETRLRSNVVLFPFFNARDDGSWGIWPLCGQSRNRESLQRYFLWPFVTWAQYREDRDTSGEGSSWMLWPLFGGVNRKRESQSLLLPPFFSFAVTRSRSAGNSGELDFERRLRLPWPFFEWESGGSRDRISVFPFYERVAERRYSDGKVQSIQTRFGWKLVELTQSETRVFPFWVSDRNGYLRIWPFFERTAPERGVSRSRVLSLLPIRWAAAVDRNWAGFWTFYGNESNGKTVDHSLLWGLLRWRTTRGQ